MTDPPAPATTPRRTSAMFTTLLRAYPVRSVRMVGLLVLAGLSEGIGIAALLPVLDLAVGPDGGPTTDQGDSLRRFVQDLLGTVGLEPTLGTLLLLVVGAMVGRGLLQWLAMREAGYAVARIAHDLRLRLLGALADARWELFVREPTGRVANSLATEVNRASWAFKDAATAMASGMQVLVGFVVAILFDWRVALAAVATGGLLVASLHGLLRMAGSAGTSHTARMQTLIGRIAELLPAIKAVKAMDRGEDLLAVVSGATREVRTAQERAILAYESMRAAREPLLTAVLAVGLFAALRTDVLTFAAVLLLGVVFYRLVLVIGDLQSQLQKVVTDESAWFAVLDLVERAESMRERADGGAPPPPLGQELRLDGVEFAYDTGPPVLQGVDVTIPAGSLVVVEGPSGAGKSTMLDLCSGLLRPTSGRVVVDGTDLGDVDVRAWRRQLGYVPQEVLLLHDTIEANVAFGDPDVSRDDVRRAIEQADLADVVDALPDGLDHVVGERGGTLSGGQQQRLAIARALVHQPRLLLMDEATSALDAATEAEILATLTSLAGDRTIVTIAHRGALADAADLVLHVEHGHVEVATRQPGANP